MADLITVKNLHRYYDQHCAVKALDFTLVKGEVLGFLGQNGAGKTTTMQMLCGNLAPSAGSIQINGIDLLSNPKAAKAHLGYLPDTPPLYKDLTVNEYLNYCAQLHRIPKARLHNALNDTKARCGLTEVQDRLIGLLSKGFQQRVGIAQAILHNPAVIILDEPTVGLDPLQIREVRQLISELGQEHGIILSTHIISEVQDTCTHVQIIQQGQLILKTSIVDLNRQLQSSSLDIITRHPVDATQLTQLLGVLSIEVLSPLHIRVQHGSNQPETLDHTVAERIAETIINAGWGLQALVPVKHTLEDEFIRLTQLETDSKKHPENHSETEAATL